MMQFIYIVITLIGCCVGSTKAGSYDRNDIYDVDLTDGKFDYKFAYRQLDDNVFAEIGEKFEPERTLYYLRKWHYLMTLGQEPEDEYMRNMRQEQRLDVERLIHASIVTPSKCGRRSYEEIRDLLQKFEDHKYNVIPYLKRQRDRLYELCRGLLDDMFLDD